MGWCGKRCVDGYRIESDLSQNELVLLSSFGGELTSTVYTVSVHTEFVTYLWVTSGLQPVFQTKLVGTCLQSIFIKIYAHSPNGPFVIVVELNKCKYSHVSQAVISYTTKMLPP
jgi:hypothetical protein